MNALQFGTRISLTLCVAAIGIAISGGAASQATADTPRDAPVIVAQVASAPTPSAAATSSDFPAYQRGVRTAAGQGTQELRRYVNRTRMIYAFYYNDFAPKE